MTALEWIRFLLGALLLLSGTFFIVSSVVGNFRFRYVLARMHAAGLGDTLGTLLLFAGILILCGFSVFTLKLLLIILLMWTTGAASSHLIMQMEINSGSSADGRKEK